MTDLLRFSVLLSVISFALHFLWEKTHIALYTGYESLEGILPVYLYATLGDVIYTLIGVYAAALLGVRVFHDTRVRDYLALSGLGLLVAIFVEAKAMWLDRWDYTDAMPLIYGFGLSPLLQMTMLLPLSVWITAMILRRLRV